MAEVSYQENIGHDHRIFQITASSSDYLFVDTLLPIAIINYINANKINVLDGYIYSTVDAWSVKDRTGTFPEQVAKNEKYMFPFRSWHTKTQIRSEGVDNLALIIRLIFDRDID